MALFYCKVDGPFANRPLISARPVDVLAADGDYREKDWSAKKHSVVLSNLDILLIATTFCT